MILIPQAPSSSDGQDVVDKIAADAQPVDSNGLIAADAQPVIQKIEVVD